MRFRYVGYSAVSGIARGQVVASSEAEAGLAVAELGYRTLELRRRPQLASVDELFPSLFRISSGELVTFARQLATLVSSGTGLLRSLELMRKQSRSRVLRRTLGLILKALDRGESFASAVSQHPQVFGHLFCRVVEVGEFTGRLDTSLRQIADLLDRESQAKKKALKSLMYPVAVVAMAVITTALLFTVALPPLLDVFNQMGASLPLPTRIAIAVAGLVKGKGLMLMAGILGLAVAGKLLLRLQGMRFRKDKFSLRLPVVGPLIVAWELSRFSRSASMLLQAGVSIPVVIDLLVGGSNNLALRMAFRDAASSVMKGESLATGLERHPFMPMLFVQMVATGEETNSLPQTMSETADAYQQQMDDRLGALISLLEPMATMGVALLIGFVAYSMFVPIYSGLGALK